MITPDDPLSQVLLLSGVRAALSTGLKARGQWALRVAPAQHLKCNVVREGECWLETGEERVLLRAGDCFLVAPGQSFLLATDLQLRAVPAEEVFAGWMSAPFAVLDAGVGNDFQCVGGRLDLPDAASMLATALPSIAILRAGGLAAKRVGWLLDRLEEESQKAALGGAAVTSALMQLVFIELLRGLPAVQTTGWLAALSDPRLGLALLAIHRDPGRRWRLSDLAETAHLSRSRFASRFHEMVGRPPMEYLLQWRMTLAQRWLSKPGATVAQVAETLGYASESAFGAAYRRATGRTPRGHGMI